ncbi:hypothetical protein ACJX0J_028769, partial [Zea mays]
SYLNQWLLPLCQNVINYNFKTKESSLMHDTVVGGTDMKEIWEVQSNLIIIMEALLNVFLLIPKDWIDMFNEHEIQVLQHDIVWNLSNPIGMTDMFGEHDKNSVKLFLLCLFYSHSLTNALTARLRCIHKHHAPRIMALLMLLQKGDKILLLLAPLPCAAIVVREQKKEKKEEKALISQNSWIVAQTLSISL